MTKVDRIVADLLEALALIRRECDKPEASRHYIDGVAAFAMEKCDRLMERNKDGYKVVRA